MFCSIKCTGIAYSHNYPSDLHITFVLPLYPFRCMVFRAFCAGGVVLRGTSALYIVSLPNSLSGVFCLCMCLYESVSAAVGLCLCASLSAFVCM